MGVEGLPSLGAKVVKIGLSNFDSVATVYFDDGTNTVSHIFHSENAMDELCNYPGEYIIEHHKNGIYLLPKSEIKRFTGSNDGEDDVDINNEPKLSENDLVRAIKMAKVEAVVRNYSTEKESDCITTKNIISSHEHWKNRRD